MTVSREVRPHGFDLLQYGDAPALLADGRVLSYADLDALVEDRVEHLGGVRRLVLLEGANDVDAVVSYLAALRGGHPVLLVPAGGAAGFADYDPDVVIAGGELTEVRPGTRHDLHPDLALLLGTSGSTGTPKLVRLSHENLHSNAAAIAAYLHLSGTDRAATTLPLQYCYGLSVVNSHLHAGASLWLTSGSVVDSGFWEDFRAAGATSFAGVPYTFDLLRASGADWTATPGLRLVTQAGGAMPAAEVRSVATACRERGVDFYVMYGATEATARMAYLPPSLAVERAGTIGVPVEGGSLRLEDGELVYSGPNVMLGYAHGPADLARGREVHELRTGDLGVQHDDGLWEVTGRRNRLAKLFGVRLDLDLVEGLLADAGIGARVVATDRLVAFVTDPRSVRRTRDLLLERHCLPAHAVVVEVVRDFPMTGSGKVDYASLASLAPPPARGAETPAEALAAVLGIPVGPDDSFVSLRGDSLSYVEASVRLERILGALPTDWPRRTARELSARTSRPRRFTALLETPVLLRAMAIVLVVGSHTELFNLEGGAHALLVLVGYNLARFALAAPTPAARARALVGSVVEVLVPSALFIVLTQHYRWPTALMLNEWLGSHHWDDNWRFWFIAVFTWGSLATAALLLVPGVDALQRRRPFAFPVGLLVGCLALRFAITGFQAQKMELYHLETAAWALALGWVLCAATTLWQRLVASGLAASSILGYFAGNTPRELVVLGGSLALLWVPAVPVPRLLVRPISSVGAASFFIYLTHWAVYPPLDADHDFWAAAASVAVGLLAWQAWTRLRRATRRPPRRVGSFGPASWDLWPRELRLSAPRLASSRPSKAQRS